MTASSEREHRHEKAAVEARNRVEWWRGEEPWTAADAWLDAGEQRAEMAQAEAIELRRADTGLPHGRWVGRWQDDGDFERGEWEW